MEKKVNELELNKMQQKIIAVAQLVSFLFMWIFVIGIIFWIINLITISVDLNDVPGVSLAISMVAIPVFIMLASILTYVYVGFKKKNNDNLKSSKED